MQKYDFTAPASGASQTVNAPGRYVKYASGTAGGNDTGLIITPGSKPGSKILLYPGQSFTLPESVDQPNGWTFANAVGQGNISGSLVIGEGRIDDNTLQGLVQVVDGGKSRSLSGVAFLGTVVTPASGAGNYNHVQLFNPANSGKRLIVEQVETVSTVGTGFNHYVTTVAVNTAAGAGKAKLFGGAASAAGLMYVQPNATQLFGAAVLLTNGPTNVTSLYKPADPFVIPPGYGWGIMGQTQNVDLTATWEWYEEPNV